MTDLDLVVAHFGHPLLPGAKHWALVVITDPATLHGTAYQVSGSTFTYEVKQPEPISLQVADAYMGHVTVGKISRDIFTDSLPAALQDIPVTLGDLQWNCQNWVIAALRALHLKGIQVDTPTLQELQTRLAEATPS